MYVCVLCASGRVYVRVQSVRKRVLLYTHNVYVCPLGLCVCMFVCIILPPIVSRAGSLHARQRHGAAAAELYGGLNVL